jgi:hypothetical protein
VRFEDQILVNAEQLQALVRQRKPKDPVALTLYREGQEQRIQVALGESKKEEIAAPVTLRLAPQTGWALGEAQGDEALRSYQGALRILESHLADSKTAKWTYGFKEGPAFCRTTPDGLTLSLKGAAGAPRLTVKDKDGKVLFEGAVQTEAQRKLLAPEIRKPVDEMIEEANKKKEKEEPRSQKPVGAANPFGGVAGPFAIVAGPSPGARPPCAASASLRPLYMLSMAGRDGASLVVSWDAEGHCTVKAQDGKVAYEGPIDTEEQRQKVPELIRVKMKKLIDLLSADRPESP